MSGTVGLRNAQVAANNASTHNQHSHNIRQQSDSNHSPNTAVMSTDAPPPSYHQLYPITPPDAHRWISGGETHLGISIPIQRTQHNQTASVRRITHHRTYLTLSTFTCLYCLFPIGLVALVLSGKSKSYTLKGGRGKAERYATAALIVNIINIVLGIGIATVVPCVYFLI